MNRVIPRRAAITIPTWNLPKKTFSNDASGGGSSSDHQVQHNNGHEEKLDVTNNVDQYDIAIIGGGMVGMALACALSSMPLTKQLNIAIIDSNPALGVRDFKKKDDLPDPRVSTVTPATISLFKDLGAWQYVQQQRHAFFDKMQVWDYTGLGYTRYNAKDVGKEILGCVVENKVLHWSLLSCLQNADFQTTIYPARLTSMILKSHSPSVEKGFQPSNLKDTPSGTTVYSDILQQRHRGCLAKLELSDGKSLYAKLVVGADGGKSRVREIAGLKTSGWNYSQNAVICTVEHTIENQCAWQRFLPDGPIALLPVGDRFSNIVWTMSPKGASDHKSMSEDAFVKSVNHALIYGYGPHPQSGVLGQYGDRFSWVTGGMTSSAIERFEIPPKVVKLASERMAFPLSLMHASDYVAHRVVLIGDAAHTVHPLAGQGVNLGFEDAFALSKVIEEGIMAGADIGELSLLKKYEKERKPANIVMMAILDGFQKAFSVDVGPVNLLRAAGFHGAQYFGPLKKSIISYATGEQKWPLFF
ncbi:FAD/NAD(P)-binding oxidoreductase family protein [Tasmannia lanceolata]|uniref:FAD/NAD(P)-binding oxidoreductase family protein n=1 Tax=Tasmannia lanceolata TaxID=3420 RepID=UPI004064B41D